MLKKSEKEKQESGPERIEINFVPGKLIFKIGEKEFYLDEGMARFLFGRKTEIEFEKLSGLHESFEEFSADDFLARFEAAYAYFRDVQLAANFLNVDGKKLRRWVCDQESNKWRGNRILALSNDIAKYKKEFFPVPEKERPIEFNLKKVAKMLKEGRQLSDIAAELGEPWEAFIKFYHENLEEIRKLMNRENLQEGHIGEPEFFGKT